MNMQHNSGKQSDSGGTSENKTSDNMNDGSGSNEIGVLRSQCLDRGIGDRKKLLSEIGTWVKQRNDAKARIKWMFHTEKAREKLAHAYPDPSKES
jgi:hypothetical protein